MIKGARQSLYSFTDNVYRAAEQVAGTVHWGEKAALAYGRNSDSRYVEIQDLKKVIGAQSLFIDTYKKRL